MIRVSTGLLGDIPCILPSKSFLVKQDTHQLCYRYGRMSIVHLDRHLLIQLLNIVMTSLILGNRRLKARRHEEILLLQPQFFSRIVIIIRIQDFYNVLRQILLFNSLMVITAVKGLQLEINDRLRIPDTQGIDNMIIITDDRVVIRNCLNRLIILLYKTYLALIIIFYTDISAEAHFLGIFRSSEFKRIAVHKPVIRRLYLITVLDLLLEHTVAVTDTASVCRISKGCQRIQEAGRQTSKSAVSKRRIRLLILQQIQVHAHLLQSFLHLCISGHIDQVVAKRPSHQEFHGHIIDDLRIILLILLLCRDPIVNDRFLHGIGNCLIQLLL